MKFNETDKVTEHVAEIGPQLVCLGFVGVRKLQNVHEDSSINVEVL